MKLDKIIGELRYTYKDPQGLDVPCVDFVRFEHLNESCQADLESVGALKARCQVLESRLDYFKTRLKITTELLHRCMPFVTCVCEDEIQCHGCHGYRLLKELETYKEAQNG